MTALIEGHISPQSEAMSVLGIPVSVTNMDRAATHIGRWIAEGETRYVCVPDSYNMMLARNDDAHCRTLIGAGMVVPDGQPLVWIGRLRGYADMGRVCGIDLLPEVCARSVETGWRHYFYGGGEGVAEDLARRLQADYPGLEVVGTDCPPFRELSEVERRAAIDRIVASRADIVWIGLGCPKQERWMHEHSALLPGKVLVGVGAAFDIIAGRLPRAPLWMRRIGLESLYRFSREPRRLWRRYLLYTPRLVVAGLTESVLIRCGLARERAIKTPAGNQILSPIQVQHGVKS